MKEMRLGVFVKLTRDIDQQFAPSQRARILYLSAVDEQ